MRSSASTFCWIAGLFTLTACSEPIVGQWEAVDENACSERSEFEVDDDLNVEGTMWIEDAANQVCYECKFEGSFDDPEDDTYQGDIDLEDCTVCDSTSHDAECKINDDGDKLDCEVDFGCGTLEDEFEKKGD